MADAAAARMRDVDASNEAFDRVDRSENPLERWAKVVRPLQKRLGSPSLLDFFDKRVQTLHDLLLKDEPSASTYTNEHLNCVIDLMVEVDVVTGRLKDRSKHYCVFDAPSPAAISKESFFSSTSGQHFRTILRDLGFASHSFPVIDAWPETVISNLHPSKTRSNSVIPDLQAAITKNTILHVFGTTIAKVLFPAALWGLARVAGDEAFEPHFLYVGNHPGVIRRNKAKWLPLIKKQLSESSAIFTRIQTKAGLSAVIRDASTQQIAAHSFIEEEPKEESVTWQPTASQLRARKLLAEQRIGDVTYSGTVFYNEKLVCECDVCTADGTPSTRIASYIREWYRPANPNMLYLDTGKVRCGRSGKLSTLWRTKKDRGRTSRFRNHGDAHGNHANKGKGNFGERVAEIKSKRNVEAAGKSDEIADLLASLSGGTTSQGVGGSGHLPGTSSSAAAGSSSANSARKSGSSRESNVSSSSGPSKGKKRQGEQVLDLTVSSDEEALVASEPKTKRRKK